MHKVSQKVYLTGGVLGSRLGIACSGLDVAAQVVANAAANVDLQNIVMDIHFNLMQ